MLTTIHFVKKQQVLQLAKLGLAIIVNMGLGDVQKLTFDLAQQ